jgi:hypothetical protein
MNRNEVRSDEEWVFSWWLDELYVHGIINRYMYESNTFTLSKAKTYPHLVIMKTKTKLTEKSLLEEHVYTPDFLIEWNEKYLNRFFRIINDETCTAKCPFFAIRSTKDNKAYTFIEVKGDFDRNNMSRLFKITQKWLYDKYGLYVDLLKLPSLFKRTWVPDRWITTNSTHQPRSINFKVITLNEYLMKLDI